MPAIFRSQLPIAGILLYSLSAPAAQAATQEPDPLLRQRLEQAIADTSSFTDRYAAEVWLVDMSYRLKRFIKNDEERLALLRLVHEEAKRAKLQPELVLAVIEVESAFDRYAISRVGARGLMQIMPFWLDELKRPDANLFHVAINLRMGCTILRHYLDREKGNLTRALARYNGSLGSERYPNKVFNALEKRWFVH